MLKCRIAKIIEGTLSLIVIHVSCALVNKLCMPGYHVKKLILMALMGLVLQVGPDDYLAK